MSETIINNKSQSLRTAFGEMRGYKDLLLMLAYRDIRVKYAQTMLGIIWSVLTPIITVLILYVVFVKIAKLDNGTIPHLVFILSGMVLWNYFASMLNHSANVFLQSQEMVKKIYFPRLLLPMSKAVSSLLELGMLAILLVIICGFYGIYPSLTWLAAPVFMVLVVILAFSVGTLLSALTIRYRDIHHVIPFVMQIGLFITPVAYPIDQIPERFAFLYYLNPMAVFIEGFRWSLFGGDYHFGALIGAILFTLFLLLVALRYFQKTVRFVADYL